jgi:hypothetical protein
VYSHNIIGQAGLTPKPQAKVTEIDAKSTANLNKRRSERSERSEKKRRRMRMNKEETQLLAHFADHSARPLQMRGLYNIFLSTLQIANEDRTPPNFCTNENATGNSQSSFTS